MLFAFPFIICFEMLDGIFLSTVKKEYLYINFTEPIHKWHFPNRQIRNTHDFSPILSYKYRRNLLLLVE